jgi:hypothetical protein
VQRLSAARGLCSWPPRTHAPRAAGLAVLRSALELDVDLLGIVALLDFRQCAQRLLIGWSRRCAEQAPRPQAAGNHDVDLGGFAAQTANLGCELALDDFGAGYASFYYLKHVPFDYLKIDGEFIQNITHDPTDPLVVQALANIAKTLGKRTVAEYVGNHETIQLLRTYGVDYAQGFYLGKPEALEHADLTTTRAIPG